MSSPPPPKNSLAAGIFSVFIMSSLTYVAIYSFQVLNDPEHYGLCPGAEAPAAWAIWTFYISAYGGVVGAGYELYLVLIGKVFEAQTIPLLQKIRGLNAGYIFTVGLLFDAFMIIATRNVTDLNVFVLIIGITGAFMSPGMFFPKTNSEKVAQLYFVASTFISMIMYLVFRTAFGGSKTTYMLAFNKFTSTFGVIVTPPSKSLRHNIQFHILRLIANILVIIGYLNATAESPCFPHEVESSVSSTFVPALFIAAISGWVFHTAVNESSPIDTTEGENLIPQKEKNYGSVSE